MRSLNYENKLAAPPDDKSWEGEPFIVAGSGPSLTPEVAHTVRMARWLKGWRVIAVNDAYKRLPFADTLYACDWGWWVKHDGARDFKGERVTSTSVCAHLIDDKRDAAKQYGLTLVNADDKPGFSTKPGVIHYGQSGSSGFQAVNLAIIRGASRIVLVGFDYRHVDGRAHFFGDHEGLRQPRDTDYRALGAAFRPGPVEILNATTGSSIDCYPIVSLEEALADRGLRRHGSEPVPRTA